MVNVKDVIKMKASILMQVITVKIVIPIVKLVMEDKLMNAQVAKLDFNS